MMKTKLIAICSLTTLLLIVNSTAQADPVINTINSTMDLNSGWLYGERTYSWTHEWGISIPADTIYSATLDITAYDIYQENIPVTLDTIYLTNLTQDDITNTTVITNIDLSTPIDVRSLLEDGSATISLFIPNGKAIKVISSVLTIHYGPSGLDYIEIDGPTEVDEGSSAQYYCTAHFTDSSTSDITNSATWSEDCDFASISSSGLLTASSVSSDESCQITATFGGKTDTYDITIKNMLPTVSIVAETPLAAEPGFNGIFTISRTGSTDDALKVYYDTGGTATSGTDYMALFGYVDILPGEIAVAVSVVVIDDTVEEDTETVELTLTPDPSYIIDPVLFSATVTIDDDEEGTPPETSGHIPAKGSEQVPRDTLIQLHITDAGSGVEYDGGPVTIHVEGDLIYDGANETSPGVYNSTEMTQTVKGICRRTGTETDYTFVFQASDLFDYEQEVNVEVYAKDKTGYEITDTYSFFTVMQTFGKNIKVNTDAGTLAQNHPDSAVDSSGNIWVVWEHTVVAGNSDIYIGKLPKDESAFEPSQLVVSNPYNQSKPAIAIDGDDTIYVVWQGKDSTGFWDIFVSTSINGTDWTNTVKVNSGDPDNESNQISPAIDIDGTGKVYIAWEDHSKGDSDIDIWAASSTDAINWKPEHEPPAPAPLKPLVDEVKNQTEPSVSIDLSDNTAYIFWTDARDIDTDIYAAKFDPDPDPPAVPSWSIDALVETNSNQWSPVGATSNGDIHLLWVDDYNGYDDIFYGKDGSSLPIEGASIVDEPETFQSSPSMSITATDTKVFACWQDSRNVSGNADTDIYYTAKSDSGFGTNILVNDDIGTYTQKTPVIGTDIKDNPFIVWADNREGNNDIYAAITTSTENIPEFVPVTVRALVPTVQIVQINEDSDNIDDADDVTIEIPGGALPFDTEIRISQLNNPPDPPEGAFGIFYEFSPSGFTFLQPVTISIPHDAADCPDYAVYNVYWYNVVTGAWDPEDITNVEHLTSLQDPTLPSDVHVVRFKTPHFTAFGVGGSATAPAAGGGGGGGGGGCSVSAGAEGNIVEFLLPYIGFIIVLVILTVRDARVRKARSS